MLECMFCAVINPFTPGSAKSKFDQFSKVTNWRKFKNKQVSKIEEQTVPQ